MVKKGAEKISLSSNKNKEKILFENLIALQKVLINLSGKIGELTGKISKLLELFESSAKAIANKEFNFPKQVNEEKINSKLDDIINQNKTIAKALSLIHENEFKKDSSSETQNQNYSRIPISNAQKPFSSTINKDLSRSPYPKKL